MPESPFAPRKSVPERCLSDSPADLEKQPGPAKSSVRNVFGQSGIAAICDLVRS